jgi:capsular exopolysaccharide synthesis family protein
MNQHRQPNAQGPVGIVIAAVLRRWWLVVVLTVIGAVTAFGIAHRQPKSYTATAALLFRDPGVAQKLFGSSVGTGSSDPDRSAATNIKLIKLPQVADETARRLELSSDEVSGAISVAAAGASDVVNVTAETNDPAKSASIATTYVRAFITLRKRTDRETITGAARLLDRQIAALEDQGKGDSTQADQLKNRRDELDIIASLQTGDAELAQAAHVPGAPSGPKVKVDTLIGLVLGFLLGVVAATLAFIVDRKFRTAREITDAFDLPVLGAIPRDRALRELAGSDWLMRRGVVEEFRSLRANLRYLAVGEALSSLLIVSAGEKEGKSTVAVGLAANAARGSRTGSAGGRVLLVECDLRRPVLADRLGIVAFTPGLAQILAGLASPAEAIKTYELPDHSSFDVVTAGGSVPNAAELLDSQQMSQFLEDMYAEYDLVILDAPAVGLVSDAIPLAAQVSGVLFVTRLRATSEPKARVALERLRRVNARVLGVVVNDARSRGGRMGHYGGEAKSVASVPG